ncbi:hypothetical protein Pmani_034741 [Petrolisthes manimaculis]|uniref:Uncharacterized protein n=1 Tax=Petrolisthes manimaculis TaxID=1843537 RepID=A0AAE1NNQ8_9EUCA|nr:hypothetical protein Pmani_034741 [Petrolisthes manimaculis]
MGTNTCPYRTSSSTQPDTPAPRHRRRNTGSSRVVLRKKKKAYGGYNNHSPTTKKVNTRKLRKTKTTTGGKTVNCGEGEESVHNTSTSPHPYTTTIITIMSFSLSTTPLRHHIPTPLPSSLLCLSVCPQHLYVITSLHHNHHHHYVLQQGFSSSPFNHLLRRASRERPGNTLNSAPHGLVRQAVRSSPQGNKEFTALYST